MSDLREQFDAMARHVRDPAAHAGPPGIEARRLKIYSDLVYNNLDTLLAGGFPVIRKTLGDVAWQALVRGFLARHHSHTPLFTELGRELVAFLESDAGSDPRRPWLAELAHYEWAELGLQLSDVAIPPHDPDGDLLDGVPLLSPLAWPLAYRWPVDRIGPDHQPGAPPPEPRPRCRRCCIACWTWSAPMSIAAEATSSGNSPARPDRRISTVSSPKRDRCCSACATKAYCPAPASINLWR